MYLENLKLLFFKNYRDLDCSFNAEMNCLVGDNGAGKTNLLDAIHYLSFSKSAFNTMDRQNIAHSEAFFNISGTFETGVSTHKVTIGLQEGQRKAIRIDGVDVQRSADLIGRFPVVLIAPNDLYMLMERSETRRRFFDMIISQLDRQYLDTLMAYNRTLRQRNSLLKTIAGGDGRAIDLLEVYNAQLAETGDLIAARRAAFCAAFTPLLHGHFAQVSDMRETIDLKYQCAMPDDDVAGSFRNALKKDIALQRTTIGIHLDDYEFEIEGYPLKKFGSQGQQKSFLIALKFAQFDTLHEHKERKPILLLDDIFDKLDDRRIQRLLDMIESHTFGQVFITDARPERTAHFVDKLSVDKQIFSVASGNISEIKV